MPPPPQNAPSGQSPVPGVTPGQSSAITFADKIVVFGPGNGVFIYQQGTVPGLGNPPIAWMSSGLVDPFGNVLPSTTGVAGSGVFMAGDTIIEPSGTFGYSGTPAAGNLIYSDTVAALTDSFGNAVPGGIVNYFDGGLSGFFAVQTFQGNINFLNSTTEAGPWNIYASLEPDATTGTLAYFDNGGNKYFIGNKAFRNNAVPVTISSTIPGPVLTIGPLLTSGAGYHVRGWALYLGNQAAGAPIFSWTSTGGLVLGSAQDGFQRFSGGGVAPVIHNNNGALGAVTGPAFASNTTNWLYEFDVYVTVTAPGSLQVTASENTAGDSFVINQIYATIEHY
jgi:hypothetical protein